LTKSLKILKAIKNNLPGLSQRDALGKILEGLITILCSCFSTTFILLQFELNLN